ncbi:hypothetical protein Rs2_27004 [Raphanus sativus]|nr:hypothetical protein Rs2_27004 [Raphanus sativus]
MKPPNSYPTPLYWKFTSNASGNLEETLPSSPLPPTRQTQRKGKLLEKLEKAPNRESTKLNQKNGRTGEITDVTTKQGKDREEAGIMITELHGIINTDTLPQMEEAFTERSQGTQVSLVRGEPKHQKLQLRQVIEGLLYKLAHTLYLKKQ